MSYSKVIVRERSILIFIVLFSFLYFYSRPPTTKQKLVFVGKVKIHSVCQTVESELSASVSHATEVSISEAPFNPTIHYSDDRSHGQSRA